MAKILLINPPFYRLLGSRYNAAQLGIGYICSYLNSKGHDAWTYNADFVSEVRYKNIQGLVDGFVDYKDYLENPHKYGIWDEVVDKIAEFNPDWVGWFCYTASVPAIRILSNKLKEKMPNTKQVVGGPHSSMDKDLLARLPGVDLAVSREGEECMLRLVEGEDPRKIKGVTSRNGKDLIATGSADLLDRSSLPFPEREKFWGLTEEEKLTVDVSYVIRTISCPYACLYCASPFAWGRKTQTRSNQSIIDEVKLIKSKYMKRNNNLDYAASGNVAKKSDLVVKSNEVVYFVDDIFPIRRKEFLELMESFVSEKLDINWKCEVRADLLDEEILTKMKEAGCKMVKIGFESASDKVLKSVNKKETKEDYLKCADLLQKVGIKCGAYMMLGFPGETDADVDETIEFSKLLHSKGVVQYFSLSLLSPYFGTPIYNSLVESGLSGLTNDNSWHIFYHQAGELLANGGLISKAKIQEFLDLSKLNSYM